MRTARISLLSVFICGSVFANVNLPIVNIGAGSVSARSAFGETVSNNKKSIIVADAAVYGQEPVVKPVVAKTDNFLQENLLSQNEDVLLPNKPRDDLWASNNLPMRIPVSTEFKTLAANYELPEEKLEDTDNVIKVAKNDSNLNSEIEKLVKTQRKTHENIKPDTISSYNLPEIKKIAAINVPEYDEKEHAELKNSDVIFRSVKPAISKSEKFESGSDFAKLSPIELKKAFQKTYLSENKHLSAYKIDDRFDVASDTSTNMEGFVTQNDLSESGGVRPLEIKIDFNDNDSALSRNNYSLLSEYAGIVVSNPKRAVQISIPQNVTLSLDARKLTARRLAIVEQILRDSGISDGRIMPVLSQRDDENFVLRVISSDQYKTLTKQKRDMFGDSVSNKTYKSLSW